MHVCNSLVAYICSITKILRQRKKKNNDQEKEKEEKKTRRKEINKTSVQRT